MSTTRTKVLEMQHELMDELEAMPPSEIANSPMDIVDLCQHRAIQEEQERRRAELHERLHVMDIVMDRIEGGTYGQCLVCDDPIEKRRQEMLPLTVSCRAHADATEASRGLAELVH